MQLDSRTFFHDGNVNGNDGFLLRANYLTKELSGYVPEFIDNVVPILQREGYMQTAYAPGTLRERLGTRHPA